MIHPDDPIAAAFERAAASAARAGLQVLPEPTTPDRIRAILTEAVKQVDEHCVVGIAVVLVSKDGDVWSEGRGSPFILLGGLTHLGAQISRTIDEEDDESGA